MTDTDDVLTASRLAVSYMVSIVTEILRTSPLDFLDMLLVGTIANFNVTAIQEPRSARRRASATDDPGRFGISRNAVSRAINIPLETVRRRVSALIEKKVLIEQGDGLIVSPENPLGLGDGAAFDAFNYQMLGDLFRALKANGIKFD